MCLAVPGKIESIAEAGPLMRTEQVDFGGVTREVNLACVPEAARGGYVLGHGGIALSVIDPAEAERVFGYLREIEAL